jgi:hypothetical protein
MGLIVIGPDELDGGVVNPGHAVFQLFKGNDKLQYKESPSGSKGRGLYCHGVFIGRKIAAGTKKNGVEFDKLSIAVISVCKNILWFRGLEIFSIAPFLQQLDHPIVNIPSCGKVIVSMKKYTSTP